MYTFVEKIVLVILLINMMKQPKLSEVHKYMNKLLYFIYVDIYMVLYMFIYIPETVIFTYACVCSMVWI
jgi:hypothetical protein